MKTITISISVCLPLALRARSHRHRSGRYGTWQRLLIRVIRASEASGHRMKTITISIALTRSRFALARTKYHLIIIFMLTKYHIIKKLTSLYVEKKAETPCGGRDLTLINEIGFTKLCQILTASFASSKVL